MNKLDTVLEALKDKPMSLGDLADKFWPNITYAYLRTMLCKMEKRKRIKVVDKSKVGLPQGGYKYCHIYAYNDVPGTKLKKKEELLPVKRKLDPRKSKVANLQDLKLDKEVLTKLVMKQNPLFVMYFGDKYL